MSFNKNNEDKVISIINSKVDVPTLTYENIRSKISMEVKKNEKEICKKNFVVKFACLLICFLVMYVSYAGLNNTIKNSSDHKMPGYIPGNVISFKEYFGNNSLLFEDEVYFYDADVSIENNKIENSSIVEGRYEIVASFPKKTNKLNVTKAEFERIVNVNELSFDLEESEIYLYAEELNISFIYGEDADKGYMLIEIDNGKIQVEYKISYLDVISFLYQKCTEMKKTVDFKKIYISIDEFGFVFTCVHSDETVVNIYEKNLN